MSCLWTFGRYLEASALPHPALSAAAIFLAGAWVGALASANLNAYYVTCGASAGVCALLGELGLGWECRGGPWGIAAGVPLPLAAAVLLPPSR